MSTEAIIDAAAGKQALLSAALNAKDVKIFCVSTAAFEGRARSAASSELVARVYEKLHEAMSILEEDQSLQQAKGLSDMQAWEELAGEMMEVKTPEFEIAKENIEVVPETNTEEAVVVKKPSELELQKKSWVNERLVAAEVAVKRFLCLALGYGLLLAAVGSSFVGVAGIYGGVKAGMAEGGIGLMRSLLACLVVFFCMVILPCGLAVLAAEKLGVDMGELTTQ
ncbi:hypothetical protein LTR22_020700 [Elasticomyces elasticus]|nr:hypothetical protein LTR22_020700 [Elasticomyces elasticus]KAK4906309.1 hypothetical protein LTR49_024507 [Elasticomyces elasticus]KAK5744293.1 hypothetical protein LTS12_023510 [Elasticomyces elasticus]